MRSCWVDRKLYKKNEKENFFLIQIYRDIVVITKKSFCFFNYCRIDFSYCIDFVNHSFSDSARTQLIVNGNRNNRKIVNYFIRPNIGALFN